MKLKMIFWRVILGLVLIVLIPGEAGADTNPCPGETSLIYGGEFCASDNAVNLCGGVGVAVYLILKAEAGIQPPTTNELQKMCLKALARGAAESGLCTTAYSPIALALPVTVGTGIFSKLVQVCSDAIRMWAVNFASIKVSIPYAIFDPTQGCEANHIDTALGCIPTDPQEFVGLAIPWAVGLAGGIAFLLMLYGVFLIIISAGTPEKIQAGKEMITSAISGLLIIVFAVFILRFIGVDILGLFDK